MRRAGELFMRISWLQGQMNDLLILARHPALAGPFTTSPEVMPAQFVDLRAEGWKRSFTSIAGDFTGSFSEFLHVEEVATIRRLTYLRNLLAHAHFSLGRSYLLYQAHGGEEKEAEIIENLGVAPKEEARTPPLFKLDLSNEEKYLAIFGEIKRLDEYCLRRVAQQIGIPHSRIR